MVKVEDIYTADEILAAKAGEVKHISYGENRKGGYKRFYAAEKEGWECPLCHVILGDGDVEPYDHIKIHSAATEDLHETKGSLECPTCGFTIDYDESKGPFWDYEGLMDNHTKEHMAGNTVRQDYMASEGLYEDYISTFGDSSSLGGGFGDALQNGDLCEAWTRADLENRERLKKITGRTEEDLNNSCYDNKPNYFGDESKATEYQVMCPNCSKTYDTLANDGKCEYCGQDNNEFYGDGSDIKGSQDSQDGYFGDRKGRAPRINESKASEKAGYWKRSNPETGTYSYQEKKKIKCENCGNEIYETDGDTFHTTKCRSCGHINQTSDLIYESKATEYSIQEEYNLQDEDGKWEMLSKADVSPASLSGDYMAKASDYSLYGGYDDLPQDAKSKLHAAFGKDIDGGTGYGEGFISPKQFTCSKCGKVGTGFSEMAQEICPENAGGSHSIPIFGDMEATEAEVVCPECQGTGLIAFSEDSRHICPECDGEGKIDNTPLSEWDEKKYGPRGESNADTTDITQCTVCGRSVDDHSNPNTDFRGNSGTAPPTDHYFLGGNVGGSDDYPADSPYWDKPYANTRESWTEEDEQDYRDEQNFDPPFPEEEEANEWNKKSQYFSPQNQWTPEDEEANEDLTPKDIEDYYASQDKDVGEDDQELLDFYASMSQEGHPKIADDDEIINWINTKPSDINIDSSDIMDRYDITRDEAFKLIDKANSIKYGEEVDFSTKHLGSSPNADSSEDEILNWINNDHLTGEPSDQFEDDVGSGRSIVNSLFDRHSLDHMINESKAGELITEDDWMNPDFPEQQSTDKQKSMYKQSGMPLQRDGEPDVDNFEENERWYEELSSINDYTTDGVNLWDHDTLEPVEYDDSIRDDLSYGRSPNYESKAGEYEVDIQDGVAEEDLEDNAGLNTSDNQAGNVFNCPSCGFKTHNRDEYDAHNNTHGNVPATVDTPLSEENIAVQNNDYQLLSRFKQ